MYICSRLFFLVLEKAREIAIGGAFTLYRKCFSNMIKFTPRHTNIISTFASYSVFP